MRDHERANRAHWNQGSDEYQEVHGRAIGEKPDALGMWRRPESDLRLLPPLDSLRVLELGCGAGQWSIWLAQQGARVTGLDLSDRQLQHAQTAAIKSNVALPLVQGSAETIP